MNQNITDIFIDNLIRFSKQSFSSEAILHAKKCVLDYIGVTLAGAKEYKREDDLLLGTWLGQKGISTVIGRNEKVSSSAAALINGISSHAVELDDGQRFGNIHPGAPVISALLSIGEIYGLAFKDLWVGVLTGYECVLRLACSIQPSHKLKGFHATGPCGTLGAAMGVAAMLNYDRSQFKSTLSTACTSASGILEMIEGDTQLMPYNAGHAALNGVVSASIGKAGFKCPADALGGNRGFLNCFSTGANLDLLVDFSGKPYYQTNYFKLYAACGHCHSGIDAALKMRSQDLFSIEDIESIGVETYKLAIQGHDHNVIDGVNSAKMSIPYSVAVALLKGTAGLSEYNEDAIKDENIIKLTSKVTVKENESITKLAPAKRISIVTVNTHNSKFSERVDFPKGQPENPLSLDEIIYKYRDCAKYSGLSNRHIQRIEELVLEADENQSISDLMLLLSR